MDIDGAEVALRSLGFFAQRRDWSMGRTVFVTLPSMMSKTNGVSGARHAVFLRDALGGWWAVWSPDPFETVYRRFDDAVSYIRGNLEQHQMIDDLCDRGFHARRHPGPGDWAIFVSLPGLRFDDGEGIHGWHKSLVLRKAPEAWLVHAERGLFSKDADEVPFSSFEAAVEFMRQKLAME
ncbi:hypothetical protein [Myxococcus faecalis]|uniref:hypothetical protein n=1 Tax=Myxococcus faecalis TaxID=3115646 RepID=UPI003CF7EFC5